MRGLGKRRITMNESHQHKEVPRFSWTLAQTWAGEDEHALLYRDERYKAQCEIITPKNKASGQFGKGRAFFFLDDDKREFGSQDELRQAILEGPKELWVYAGSTRGKPSIDLDSNEFPDDPQAA